MAEQRLGELLEKLIEMVSSGTVNKVESNYQGMSIMVYSMGAGRIRVDLKE